MSENDDWIDDEDLLIEAARYAVKIGFHRDHFMSLAKQAWFKAATEAGRDPQTIGKRRKGRRGRRGRRDKDAGHDVDLSSEHTPARGAGILARA
jgi:hypothetical protein